MKAIATLLLAAILSIGAQTHSLAADVPYQVLHQSLAPSQIIDRYPRLRSVQRVVSRLPGVTAAQIEIRIEGKSPQKIALSEDGRMQFPLSDALLKENPMVHSNQPRGSLSISAVMEFKLSGAQLIGAKDMLAMLDDANAALSALGLTEQGASISGIEFQFPSGSQANAEISAGRFENLLVADQTGRIVVRIHPKWQAKGATLKFSTAPLSAKPHVENSRPQ